MVMGMCMDGLASFYFTYRFWAPPEPIRNEGSGIKFHFGRDSSRMLAKQKQDENEQSEKKPGKPSMAASKSEDKQTVLARPEGIQLLLALCWT